MKALIALGLVVGVVVICGLMALSYRTTEVQLRNAIVAQQKANETSFDTCWKIIQQQAQVADSYKDSFKEIYVGLMEGRHYEAGGSLFKMIKEANPKFSDKLFVKVANSVEGQRTVFKRDQQKLIDMNREHDNLIDSPVSGLFLMGKQKIEIKIVTSSKTTESFNTGKEDDLDIRGKKQ